jgi:hypothetical protein
MLSKLKISKLHYIFIKFLNLPKIFFNLAYTTPSMNTITNLFIFRSPNSDINIKLKTFFSRFFIKYFLLNKILLLKSLSCFLENSVQLHKPRNTELSKIIKLTPLFYKYKIVDFAIDTAFNQFSRKKILIEYRRGK